MGRWARRWASTLFARANGTGPFQLASWDRAAQRLTLERAPKYWREPARLARVTLRSIEDSRARRRMLEHGDCDIAVVERRYLPQFQGLAGVVAMDGLPLMEAHNVVFLNQAVDPAAGPWLGSGRLDGEGVPPDFFADLDTRRAFREAFDYGRFIQEGYQGKAQRAHGPIPSSVFGWTETPPPATHSERAEQFLKRAHKGQVWEKGFLVTIGYTKGRSDRRLACKILKEALAASQPAEVPGELPRVAGLRAAVRLQGPTAERLHLPLGARLRRPAQRGRAVPAFLRRVRLEARLLVDASFAELGDVDTAVTTLRFSSGALGAIDNSRKAVYGYDQRAEVFGSGGCVVLPNEAPTGPSVWDAQGRRRQPLCDFFVTRYQESYLAEMRAFARAVLEDRAPLVTGLDGLKAVLISVAARQSVRERRPVKVAHA